MRRIGHHTKMMELYGVTHMPTGAYRAKLKRDRRKLLKLLTKPKEAE